MPRYATTADLARFGLPAHVLAEIPTAEQEAALDAASGLADDYLSAAHALPLTSWGMGLRRAVAIIAAFDLLRVRGFSPEGVDEVLVETYEGVLRWLDRVAAGRVPLAGVVDATPAEAEGAAWADSDEPRGL